MPDETSIKSGYVTPAKRRVHAKNRWHAALVILRESLLHPNTATELLIGPPPEQGRRKAEHVTAWPVDNAEAVAALTLYTGPVEHRDFDWFEAVGVVETIVRHQVAAEFDRMAGNRNPDDPEGISAYSRWAMNAADRIRHPERYGGVARAN